MKLCHVTTFAALMLSAASSLADTHKEYEARCFQEMGVHVPAFNCLNGEPVPGLHTTAPGLTPEQQELINRDKHAGPCVNPDFIGKGNTCNPGTLQVVYDDGDVIATALCRKDTLNKAKTDNFYDIAVIQTRRSTGATCFFQRREALSGQSPEVKSPGDPELSSTYFDAPLGTISFCTSCHDGVSIIRSPYIARTVYDGKRYDATLAKYVANPSEAAKAGKPVLPNDFNKAGDPYWVVRSTSTYYEDLPVSLNTDGNPCTGCHVIGSRLKIGSLGAISTPDVAMAGSLKFSAMSVLSTQKLQGALGLYTALDPATEKWWMPAGRVDEWHMANGAAVNPADFSLAYYKLEACRSEFVRMNEGRDVAEGVLYPDRPECRVQPRSKLTSLYNIDPRVHRVTNDAIPYLALVQYTSRRPALDYFDVQDNGGKWQFYANSANRSIVIRNQGSGEFLCVDGLTLKTCPTGLVTTKSYRWSIRPYNDYRNTSTGLPSGDTFRIESYELPGKYLYINDALELSFGAADLNTSRTSVWRPSPLDVPTP